MTWARPIAATAIFAIVALAACSSAATTGPSGAASVGSGATTAPTTPRATIAPSVPPQTDTAWGRIWDGVPDSFPMPSGAMPATDTGEGASSGQLVVAGDAGGVSNGYVSDLRASGWTVSRDGPLEDGSIVVNGLNGEGCQAQVSVKSIGDASLVTILYGSGCPFD
jgi:hypothetical protein